MCCACVRFCSAILVPPFCHRISLNTIKCGGTLGLYLVKCSTSCPVETNSQSHLHCGHGEDESPKSELSVGMGDEKGVSVTLNAVVDVRGQGSEGPGIHTLRPSCE